MPVPQHVCVGRDRSPPIWLSLVSIREYVSEESGEGVCVRAEVTQWTGGGRSVLSSLPFIGFHFLPLLRWISRYPHSGALTGDVNSLILLTVLKAPGFSHIHAFPGWLCGPRQALHKCAQIPYL